MKRLATVGYEGAALDDFVATLAEAGVDLVIDVRELAMSRRKGFAKTALSTALDAAGIEYLHLRELGDPKAGREAARAGKFDVFRKIYAKHLSAPAAREALGQVKAAVGRSFPCLLCFERDPNHCHRTMIAAALANEVPLQIVNLGVRSGLAKQRHGKSRARAHARFGQGAAAAE